MTDNGWDSDSEIAYTPVYTATFSRGGGRGRGGSERWNDGSRGGGRQGDRNKGGGRCNDDGGSKRRGRGGYESWRNDKNSTSMSTDSSNVGRIIGTGGSKIRELENGYGEEIKIEKNNNYSDRTHIMLRGSPESQNKAKGLIEDLLSDSDRRGGGGGRGGGFRGNRRGNTRDHSNIPIRRCEGDDVEAPIIDWDEINRQYKAANMDWAAYSPVKSRCMLNQLPPKLSAHKRSRFPSNSPQSDDLGVISDLSSSDSETCSPCPVSPASSVTPEKVTTQTFGKILQISDYSEFGISSPPQKAHHVHSKFLKSNKENVEKNVSFKKNSQRKILSKGNFEDWFDTILPDPSQQSDESQEQITFKKTDNFTAPKKTTQLAHNQTVRKSPRLVHKDDVTVIKPKSFYGNIAPVLATNQTNRIQGMKCVFRPHQPSKAKAKLVFDEKPSKKRERSRSLEYTLRFDEELGTKRKFFETKAKEGASLSSRSHGIMSLSFPKKGKLLDTRKSYLEESSPIGSQLTADMSDLIDEYKDNKSTQRPATMDWAVYSPVKSRCMLNQLSPKVSAQVVRKSPRLASKNVVTIIKPKSCYGNITPMLVATNQTNRIQGMKCVSRPCQPSKAKAKFLLLDETPAKKQERSRMDVSCDSKRSKTLFTGVNYAIKKHKPSPASVLNEKRESIREKAKRVTDLSRTSYALKKNQKNGWENTLRFDEELGTKRKLFKTVNEVASLSSRSHGLMSLSFPKKGKLLDTRKSYLEESSPIGSQLTADISDVSDAYKYNKSTQNSSDNFLLRLEEEDDSDENKRKLKNIFVDSTNKNLSIDYLSNYTARLNLIESPSDSAHSRADLEYTQENKNASSKMLYSIFNSPFSTKKARTLRKDSSSKVKWQGAGKDLLQIDDGQKLFFGAFQCGECGMIYQRGEAEDETQHNDFHNKMTSLRHTGWKNEQVVGYYGTDHVIVVTADDPKSWQQRALEVINLVDKSLVIRLDEAPTTLHNQKVFLYISDKRIVGCMTANPVAQAHKMLGSESDVNLFSEETFPVRCGISRMWTLYSHRRMGVATRLLDAVRCQFMFGRILSKKDIAFNIPTPDGKQFAAKYMGFPDFYINSFRVPSKNYIKVA